MTPATSVAVGGVARAFLAVSPAPAQDSRRFLSAPSLKVERTITCSNLFKPPRVQELPDGLPVRDERETDFEIILSVDTPTELPRVGFTVGAIWTPFGETSTNPFTGRTADGLVVRPIRDTPVELEFELNLKCPTRPVAGSAHTSTLSTSSVRPHGASMDGNHTALNGRLSS